MKRIIALALILIVMATLLAGCGNSPEDPVGHYTLKEARILNSNGKTINTSASLDINEDGTFTCMSYSGTWEKGESSGGACKYTFHVNGKTKSGYHYGSELRITDIYYDSSSGSVETVSVVFTR